MIKEIQFHQTKEKNNQSRTKQNHSKKKKCTRGKRNKLKSVLRTLVFGGANVDGARGKWGT